MNTRGNSCYTTNDQNRDPCWDSGSTCTPCSNSYCTATSTTTITTRPATTKPTTTKCASKGAKYANGKDYGPVAGVSGDPANGKDDDCNGGNDCADPGFAGVDRITID